MLRLVTAPTGDIITVAQFKTHARIDVTDDDTLIQGYINAAIDHLDGRDGILGRALRPQTWDYITDSFPRRGIELPTPPTISVDSVKYLDTSYTEQTLATANYRVVQGGSGGSVIRLADGYTWPVLPCEPDAVRVRFQCGYSDDSSGLTTVPEAIRQAVYLIVAHWYENREEVSEVEMSRIPMGAKALLSTYTEKKF